MAEKSVKRGKLSSIWWRMAQNINEDYLELFLITSRAAGLEPSEGRSFGVGKSTFAVWMAYRAFTFANGTLYFNEGRMVDETPEDEKIEIMKHVVKNYVKYSLDDGIEIIRTTNKLIPALILDDIQDSCPAYQHIPPKVRRKIEYLTRVRQRVANIICTAPSMGEIAKPLRQHINWEIIIPTRGVYEVQFIGKRRDFYNPTEDRSRLWYEVTGTFEPLPKEVDHLYKQLRDEQLDKVEEKEERERENEKQGVPVECPNCGHVWTSRVERKRVQCPKCFRSFVHPQWNEKLKTITPTQYI